MKNVTPKAALALIETPESRLDEIAAAIMSSWSRGIDEEFAIGHLLREAADLFPPMSRSKDEGGKQAGSPFGDWVRSQGFPFTMKTAYRLRTAAEREPEVRAFIEEHKANSGRDLGVNTAITRLLDDRVPADRVAAVQELVGIETDPPIYTSFVDASSRFVAGISQLPDDALASSAKVIQSLATAYSDERSRRQARQED